MTRPEYDALTGGKRRLLVARALLRSVGTAAALIALYYTLPLTGDRNGLTFALLFVAGAAFVALAWIQARAIVVSDYPAVRAIEALSSITPLFILTFATTYFILEKSSAGNFSQPLSRTDALYFTVTTFSTVGFGDITAKSDAARLIVTAQMLADLVVLGVGVRVFLGAVKVGQERRASSDGDGDGGQT